MKNLKVFSVILGCLLALGLGLVACDSGGGGGGDPGSQVETFVPVTNITGVPTAATAGSPLILIGTVVPSNATNKTIIWSLVSGTGTVSGSTLNVTAAGQITVKATITNGTAKGTNYTKDFTITASTAGGHNGTPGLAFEPIGNPATAYRVRKGTVTSGAVVIPTTYNGLPVTEIGSGSDNDGAFRDCTGLTSITLPNSVTSIGRYAFYNCTGITSITIPAGVTYIGVAAFAGCSSLTSITIPDSVTSIGGSAFSGCRGLTSITIPDSVTSIDNNAFSGCRGLTEITIPDSVTSIGSGVFYGCTGLTGITLPFVGNTLNGTSPGYFGSIFGAESGTNPNSSIPASLKTVIITGGSSIGYGFRGCRGLTSITLPSSVTYIPGGAFSDCTSLTSITVDANNPNYSSEGGILYNKARTFLIQAPEGISGAVTIPDSVTVISVSAFENCTGLTSVTIPSSVTTIPTLAFSGCSGLTSIIIPNSVKSIGQSAFSYCSGLTSVTFQGLLSPDVNSAAFGFPDSDGYIGDLRNKYLAGGGGTYTRASGLWRKI